MSYEDVVADKESRLHSTVSVSTVFIAGREGFFKQ